MTTAWTPKKMRQYAASEDVSTGETVDKRIHIQMVQELATEMERLEGEWAEYGALFDIRHRADMRAILRWRAERPAERASREPEHADLLVWLMNELERQQDQIVDKDASHASERMHWLDERVRLRAVVHQLRTYVWDLVNGSEGAVYGARDRAKGKRLLQRSERWGET